MLNIPPVPLTGLFYSACMMRLFALSTTGVSSEQKVNKTLIKRKSFAVFDVFFGKMLIFAAYYILMMFTMERNVNRIKVVLAERRKTNPA